MKTSIKTLIATSLTAIVLSSAVFTTNVSATEKEPDAISKISAFKRISVKGKCRSNHYPAEITQAFLILMIIQEQPK
jgi:hypothetical protein